MQPLQNCIGPTIRIGREIRCIIKPSLSQIRCVPYAGFFFIFLDLTSGLIEAITSFWCTLVCHGNIQPHLPSYVQAEVSCRYTVTTVVDDEDLLSPILSRLIPTQSAGFSLLLYLLSSSPSMSVLTWQPAARGRLQVTGPRPSAASP